MTATITLTTGGGAVQATIHDRKRKERTVDGAGQNILIELSIIEMIAPHSERRFTLSATQTITFDEIEALPVDADEWLGGQEADHVFT